MWNNIMGGHVFFSKKHRYVCVVGALFIDFVEVYQPGGVPTLAVYVLLVHCHQATISTFYDPFQTKTGTFY